MCGIAGLLGVPEDLARPAAQRMLASLRHRGPDGQGIERVAPVAGAAHPAYLVHARLAILDLTDAGRQPMCDHPPAGPANWVTFNGEVFNYQELHAELAQAGWPCHTRCDTEVILHGYRAWGEACVERFRGMFAWCLLDAARGRAWLCRDRLGVKPVYYCPTPQGGLLFASEVRTLLQAGPELLRPAVSAAALESYLAQGAVCGLDSIVAGVRLLGPGESLFADWSGKTEEPRRYWRVPFTPDGGATADAAAWRPVAATLRDSVRLRLISDVPVGLFLSGGIDSAALATVATEVAAGAVKTVTVGFDQPEFDESNVAAQVARALGTEHRTIPLTGAGVLADLPRVLEAVDQPTVDGFNTYLVSRAARQAGLTVALSGTGGDELFGGYASFTDVPRAVRWGRLLRRAGPVRGLLRRALGWMNGRGSAKAAELLARQASPVTLYLLRRELFLPAERRQLLRLPADSDPVTGLPRSAVDALTEVTAGLEGFNLVSALEIHGYLRNMLLRDADVFSMAHGLEVRVPLLDHKLVEMVAALPGAAKAANGRVKPLLADAAGPRLPEVVRNLPKRGFTFPWDAWLRGAFRDRAATALGDHDVWRAAGLQPTGVADTWRRFERRDRRVSPLQVLALLILHDFVQRHGLTRRL
jgi:asparagine synthase (glutamine-hydrolysing)